MKKIILMVMSVLLVAALSGCGAGNVGGGVSSTESTPESETVSKIQDTEVDDNLDGLVKFMTQNKYILAEAKDAKEMKAGFVGAKVGKKFEFKVGNSTVKVELYEYDPGSLDATAKKVIESVQKDGKFPMLDREVSGAVMSESGKYLMIYDDAATEDANVKHAEETKAAFKGFRK